MRCQALCRLLHRSGNWHPEILYNLLRVSEVIEWQSWDCFTFLYPCPVSDMGHISKSETKLTVSLSTLVLPLLLPNLVDDISVPQFTQARDLGVLISSFISHLTNHQGLGSIYRSPLNGLQLVSLLAMHITPVPTLTRLAHCDRP